MVKVSDIIDAMERLAPPALAENWDNVGLMTGDRDQRVTTVFVCLDVTSDNVRRAAECGADLIISHHPLIFTPLRRIVEQDITGSILRNLIRNDISVYSAHTNLDHADGGMNDALAARLDLTEVRRFSESECVDETGAPLLNIGRVGTLSAPMEMADFADMVRDSLGCRSLRYVGAPEDIVKTVAVCSGAGGDGIYSAYHAGADVYVTSDIRHHEAQLAFELGINLIDAGHFETEHIVCALLASYLESAFPELNVIPSDAPPYFNHRAL